MSEKEKFGPKQEETVRFEAIIKMQRHEYNMTTRARRGEKELMKEKEMRKANKSLISQNLNISETSQSQSENATKQVLVKSASVKCVCTCPAVL